MKPLKVMAEYSNQIKEQLKFCLKQNNIEDAEKLQVILNDFTYCENLIKFWKNTEIKSDKYCYYYYLLNGTIRFKTLEEASEKTGVNIREIKTNLKGVTRTTRRGVFTKKIINTLKFEITN